MRGIAKRKRKGSCGGRGSYSVLTATSVMTVGFRRNTFKGISVEDLTSVWV